MEEGGRGGASHDKEPLSILPRCWPGYNTAPLGEDGDEEGDDDDDEEDDRDVDQDNVQYNDQDGDDEDGFT